MPQKPTLKVDIFNLWEIDFYGSICVFVREKNVFVTIDYMTKLV